MVREASIKTATEAGDGTTTAIVLTQSIIHAALKRIKSHMNNTTIIRHMQQLGEDICKKLDKMSKKVTPKRLVDVATISANNDKEIGKIISSTYEKVGKGGVVLVENADGSETHPTLRKVWE